MPPNEGDVSTKFNTISTLAEGAPITNYEPRASVASKTVRVRLALMQDRVGARRSRRYFQHLFVSSACCQGPGAS